MTKSEVINGLRDGSVLLQLSSAHHSHLKFVKQLMIEAFPKDKHASRFFEEEHYIVGVSYGASFLNPYEFVVVESSKFPEKKVVKSTEITLDKPVIIYRYSELGKKNKAAICAIMSWGSYSVLSEFVGVASVVYTKLKEAGVADVWLEPVYEVAPIDIKIGTPTVDTTINKYGVSCKGEDFDIASIITLHKTLTSGNGTFGSHKITFPSVKLGCTVFSVEDIEQVIDIHKKNFR